LEAASPTAGGAGASADSVNRPIEQAGERDRISQAGEQRFARIETIRALGAMAVVVTHAGVVTLYASSANGIPSGNEIVPRAVWGFGNAAMFVFFALSGFLIYMPFAKRDFGGGGPVILRNYALNRALRILPLYLIAVATVLIVQYRTTSIGLWARFLSFSQNYDTRTAYHYLAQTWTVVVEVHFYLLLPFMAAGISRFAKGSRQRALGAILAIGLASLAIRAITVYSPGHSILWRPTILVSMMFIAAGMFAAVMYIDWEERKPTWLRGPLLHSDVWLLAGLPFLLAFCFLSFNTDAGCAIMAVFVVVAAAFPHLHAGPLTRVLSWRPLAYIGVATYSTYLWHGAILALLIQDDIVSPKHFWVLAVVALPLSLAVGMLSYRVIEEPFLRLRRRWSRSAPPQTAAPDATAEAAAAP
jgi:acetyltransferase